MGLLLLLGCIDPPALCLWGESGWVGGWVNAYVMGMMMALSCCSVSHAASCAVASLPTHPSHPARLPAQTRHQGKGGVKAEHQQEQTRGHGHLPTAASPMSE